MLSKRIQSLEKTSLKLNEYEELQTIIEGNIDTQQTAINNMVYAQHIRNKKIQNIKDNIADLQEQLEYLQQITKDGEKEKYKQIRKLQKIYTKNHILNQKINDQLKTKRWNKKMIRCINNNNILKCKPSADEQNAQIKLHKNIRKLPDDIIRYLYGFITYDTRISLFEHKYKIYNTISQIKEIIKIKNLFTNILIKPCKYDICPNSCKNCKLHNDIWNHSKVDVLILFRSFIQKNTTHLTDYKRYILLRRSVLFTIVQNKYNNK